ncbi:hypothetical protein HYH03_002963 [Edaphochlamys debaryana]|uniref:SnoaL-like domain-containing protein n=1 Tax=Edaphochlamys debaryana TaxID=47281 RepID=A0A836C526_9CHLO|nr:hypothetical protein HYH03_002963 [Edaphochlamys debaryana]|eukprot:KAG2499389.1 hypothetical protein HYH03_002963 [Edaphochlamys debaryana]
MTAKGRRALQRFFAWLPEAYDIRQLEPTLFAAEGSRVVFTVHITGTGKETAQAFDTTLVHLATVREGKVALFKEVVDTAYMNPILGPRAFPPG